MIGLIKTSLKKSMVKIKVGNVLSREVQINTGLRQGDTLSPFIFNLFPQKIVRLMNTSPGEGTKLGGRVKYTFLISFFRFIF